MTGSTTAVLPRSAEVGTRSGARRSSWSARARSCTRRVGFAPCSARRRPSSSRSSFRWCSSASCRRPSSSSTPSTARSGSSPPEGGLEEFIHVGMPPETVAAIGHLPEGRGVLGALIDDPRPIRLQHIGDDPRSVGFPPGHPPMDGFLGCPDPRARRGVRQPLPARTREPREFTAEDEQLVTALAATAGFAIANARLFDETRLRQLWTASSAQIASSLLDTASGSALPMLADELIARTTADRICIVLPGPRTAHRDGRRGPRRRRRRRSRGRDPRDAHGRGHRARERRVPVAPGRSSTTTSRMPSRSPTGAASGRRCSSR